MYVYMRIYVRTSYVSICYISQFDAGVVALILWQLTGGVFEAELNHAWRYVCEVGGRFITCPYM